VNNMITPPKDRMRKTRDRRRLGVIPIHVEVSRLEIDFLARRGYGTRADDPASVSQAVSSFPSNPGPRPARRPHCGCE